MLGLPGFRLPYIPITLNTLCLRPLFGCPTIFFALDRSLWTRADTLWFRTHRVD